jgi:hypothetical protein
MSIFGFKTKLGLGKKEHLVELGQKKGQDQDLSGNSNLNMLIFLELFVHQKI